MPQRRRRDQLLSKPFIRAAVRYPREVATCVRKLVNSAPKPKKASEEAVLDIVRTAANRTLLVSRLMRDGRYLDAAILVRTVIDLAQTCVYLTDVEGIAREHRVSRFLGFEPVQMHEVIRRSNVDATALLPSVFARRRKISAVFEDIEEKQNIGWAGLSNQEMTSAIRDRDSRRSLERLRTRYAFLFSAFVHPTPMGVGSAPWWGDLVVSDLAWCSSSCLFILCRCLVQIGTDVKHSAEVFESETERFHERSRRALVEDDQDPPLPLLEWIESLKSKR